MSEATQPMVGDVGLNHYQHAALDRLAERDPWARVIGWSMRWHSPLIARRDGVWVVVTRGGEERRVV